MISLNELRIGNVVECHFQTTRFLSPALSIDPQRGVMVQDGDYKSYYSKYNVDGVRLTPGVLRGCGFEWDNGDAQHWHRGRFILTKSKDYADGRLMAIGKSIDPETPCYLFHLHQLQNLYFALTGNELLTGKEFI